MKTYRLVERLPSVEEYNSIRQAAGLRPKHPEAAARGLQGSLYAVCLCVGASEEAVGMGRVVGDGGLCFDIVDLAIVPEYQGLGYGALLMQKLMDYVHAHAYPSAFISLMTEEKLVPFYKKFGFKVRGPTRPGMSQFIDKVPL